MCLKAINPAGAYCVWIAPTLSESCRGRLGAKQVHEVHVGGNATPGCSAATLGLSLAEAKSVLAGLQRHLVQAQAEEHCQVRRRSLDVGDSGR